MKFNVCYPQTGAQICIEIDDDKKYAIFFDQRMGAEVPGDTLGDQYKGYIFKIMGGNDRDGFPMKQGVMIKGRTRLLMCTGHKCFYPRRTGEKRKKSVRGCIVGADISVLALKIVKKGQSEIPGLTDIKVIRRLGPKRASKIRKLLGISKKDDKKSILLRKSVVRRTFDKNGKKRQKAPKIQRLVTSARLRRKKIFKNDKKEKWQKRINDVKEYFNKISEMNKKKKEAKEAQVKVDDKKKKEAEVKIVKDDKKDKKAQTQQQQAPKK